MCGVSFCCLCSVLFFFKQKTAYEMRISDWSSDVCSSDLLLGHDLVHGQGRSQGAAAGVRQLQKLQRALQSTVFAMASVQGNENTVKAGTDQIDQCVDRKSVV